MKFVEVTLSNKLLVHAASDKAAEDQRLVSTGSSMINQLSSTLTSIQSSNSSSSSPVDLVSTLMGLFGGASASSTGTDALSALTSAGSLQCKLSSCSELVDMEALHASIFPILLSSMLTYV